MTRIEKSGPGDLLLSPMWGVSVLLVAGVLGAIGAFLIWGDGNWPASAVFAVIVALIGFCFARRESLQSHQTPRFSDQEPPKEQKETSLPGIEREHLITPDEVAAEASIAENIGTMSIPAKDGTIFRYDRDLLRGHTTVICRKNLSPPLEEVVALYDELYAYVLKEVRRNAKKLGLYRPPMISRDLLLALVRTVVLELLRSRNGHRERLRNAYNFSKDDGVRSAVERMLKKNAGCNDRLLDAICGYLFGMKSEEYHRCRMAEHREKSC